MAVRAAEVPQSVYLLRSWGTVAGVEAVQPFGEVGFQLHMLLLRILRPAVFLLPVHFGIFFDDIAVLRLVVDEFIEERAGVGEALCPGGTGSLQVDLDD